MRTARPLEVSGKIVEPRYTELVDAATCDFMSEYYPKYTVYFWGPEKALTSRGGASPNWKRGVLDLEAPDPIRR